MAYKQTEASVPLCCPVCRQMLDRESGRYVCPEGHSFDLAKEGYVNLLTADKRHSTDPGDTKEMVRSRRAFLDKEYYAPFALELSGLSADCLRGVNAPNVVDIGCGEGYYTRYLKDAAGPHSALLGFDISKWAVRYAAKRNRDCQFAVASAFHIPAPDAGTDLAVNLFAPLEPSEICRVLRPGGYLIYAVPGPRHLFALKEILYDQPYENTQKDTHYPGLKFLRRATVKDTVHLSAKEEVQALFAMTPYYWKTPKEGAARLQACASLTTEIHFDFLIYQKPEVSTFEEAAL